MNDILSQIIAYSPNKIDTETKARAMVQGPRNIKLAEVPRSEMDNFNTPDLEQAPDSYLRPGETLEDFDVEFRRPNAQGGVQQLVSNTVDGSRPGYAGRPLYKGQKTIQKKQNGVLTYAKKGAPIKYYDPKEYGSEAKAFKAAKADVEASQVSKKTANIKNIDIGKVKELRAKGISIKKIADELGVEQRTISDRLKKAGESTKDLSTRDAIPKEIQKDIKAKYSSVKNWDFNKFTYGISPTSDIKLYEKISNFVAEPKPYEIAGDFSKADGWLAAQMNRSYKLGNKNYTPIKAMVNNKNKIVGFIDNTEFGGGGKYIVNEKFIKGKNADGVLMSLHPDYENTAKFVDISKKAKLPVQGVLKDLLKNEGVDTNRISLSDLFKYMKGEVGIEGTKSALEKHHISGVKNRATGNYQLLDRDLNILARDVETEIRAGDLSREGEIKKKGVMVEIDGQTYGSGPKTPEGQFKRFEKQITNFFQNNPNSKNVIVRMAKIGCPGKANGGRIGFDQGLNVTSCAAKGVEKLQGDPGKLTPGDQANVRALAKSGKAVKFLKGVLGPGAILGEVLLEGGIAANKFMDQGMPIKQALGESYINKYVLGPKSQIDVEAERAKEFAKGEDFAMAERGRRMAPFMAQSATADAQRLKDRMKQMEKVKTYENFKPNYGFTKEEFEDTMRQIGSLKEDQVYRDDFYKQQVEKPIEFKQLMELPSFKGTQKEFMEGGIASLNVKK